MASICAMAEASKHPIRDEIVNEIKLKTNSWKPKEVSSNHLRHRSVESIKTSMGHLGMTPTSIGAEMFKKVSRGALDMFKQMTSAFGVSKTKVDVHHLKQEPEFDSDLPDNFSWR